MAVSLRAIINEVRRNIVEPIVTAVTDTPAVPAVPGGAGAGAAIPAPMGTWDAKVFKENLSANVLRDRLAVAAAAAPPAAAGVAAAANLTTAINAPDAVVRESALAAVLNNLNLRGVASVAGVAGVPAAVGVPAVPAVAAVPANGDVVILLADIFNKNYIVSKSGKLIFNLPKSDELVNRLLSVAYARSRGMDVNPSSNLDGAALVAIPHDRAYADAVTVTVNASRAANRDDLVTLAAGTLYNSMPASDRDQYKSLLALTPNEVAAFEKWDERVDKIREVLSQGPGSSSAGIEAPNIVKRPELNSISQLNSLPPVLKDALLRKRASDPSNPITKLTHLRVAMNGGDATMRGGNANPHAPLYPRIVMNGGAHPLATYMGGAAPDVDAPVRALMARINGLRDQFKSATGGPADFPGAAATLSRLDTWKDDVKNGLNSLQENLDRLAKINAAVSQYRPGLGVDVNAMTDQQLKDLVKQADDLNKQAQKSAKQFDKLKEISDLLQQLVDKQNAAPIAR